MPRDGSATRERILDTAQDLILERGFAGVSIDRIIEGVGMTKGAFFYHYKNKNDLALALIRRFREHDEAVLRENLERSAKLGTDPLQRLLIFVGLFEEMFEAQPEPYVCLFASYVYELEHFDPQTRELVAGSFLDWRSQMRSMLEAAAAQHPPRIEVDLASLADTFTVVLEGAFVTARALDDADVIPRQIRQFRNYLELLFAPAEA